MKISTLQYHMFARVSRKNSPPRFYRLDPATLCMLCCMHRINKETEAPPWRKIMRKNIPSQPTSSQQTGQEPTEKPERVLNLPHQKTDARQKKSRPPRRRDR